MEMCPNMSFIPEHVRGGVRPELVSGSSAARSAVVGIRDLLLPLDGQLKGEIMGLSYSSRVFWGIINSLVSKDESSNTQKGGLLVEEKRRAAEGRALPSAASRHTA